MFSTSRVSITFFVEIQLDNVNSINSKTKLTNNVFFMTDSYTVFDLSSNIFYYSTMFKYFNEKSLINPAKFLDKINNFPEIAVITWQKKFLNVLNNSAEYYVKPLKTSFNDLFEVKFNAKTFVFGVIPIGGPYVSSFME